MAKIAKKDKITPTREGDNLILNNQVDNGNSDIIEIDNREEQWSIYRLKDGNQLKVKAIPVEVRKLKYRKTSTGDPVYAIKSVTITDVTIDQDK